jgi:site-specific recombinase XerD
MPRAEIGQLIVLKSGSLNLDVQGFLLDRRARNCAPKTVEFYSFELPAFCGYLRQQGIQATDAVTAHYIRSYLANLSEHRSPGGCACAFRSIRAFFRWFALENDLPADKWRNPLARLTAPLVFGVR